MKNKLTLLIGDKEVTLKFNMGTLVAMKELSGAEPFSMLRGVSDEDVVQMFTFACCAIRAGIMINYNVEDSGISQEQLNDLSVEDLTSVIKAFTKAYSSGEEAETVADTQPSANLR